MCSRRQGISRALTGRGEPAPVRDASGPVLDVKILGHTELIERFPTSDRYANYSGTGPSRCPAMTRSPTGSRSGNRDPKHPAHGSPRSTPPPRPRPRLLPAQRTPRGEQAGGHALSQARGCSRCVYRQLCDDMRDRPPGADPGGRWRERRHHGAKTRSSLCLMSAPTTGRRIG